ncbi:transposase for IS26 [Klebsiella pneumoniae]|nr:transposase for IS26 [Klebsiella pneumoniae]
MNPFKGRHFQRDIILWAVRWYCKYGISYRGFSVMRLKWKNGCAGTGVTLPIFARGTWMKPT